MLDQMVLSMYRAIQLITHSQFKLDKKRLNLYFDKYQYKFSLTVDGLGFFRGVKTYEAFNERLAYCYSHDFYIKNTAPILKFVDWRAESDANKYTVYFHDPRVDIYFSDIAVIQTLVDEYDTRELIDLKPTYTRVEKMIGFDNKVVYQVNPKHKYRVYLKSRKYTQEERQELYDYLKDKDIKIGEALRSWLLHTNSRWNGGLSWSWTNHCFDLNDESLITLLYLRFDTLIGKVCEIQKKINT